MTARNSGARQMLAWATLGIITSCGTRATPVARPCDEVCRDRIALRAIRETLKLVYNLTLQGQPVGSQDASTPCPLGGSARVFGEASSVPEQGATRLSLTYELESCATLERDEEAEENYALVLQATLQQAGVLAVQPSATSALLMHSDALTLRGAVGDPPVEYTAQSCPLDLTQNGNHLSGTLCGRSAGLDL